MVEIISDIGNIRELNEDAAGNLLREDFNLFVVCDGMGGHNAGEVASSLALETINKYLEENFRRENAADTLTEAVELANQKIYLLSRSDHVLKGMGTTVTSALACDGYVHVAHVGDSSMFRIRDGAIRKVTKDHSLVQELVDMGSITKAEARVHPNKNIITRAVGTNEKVTVDTFHIRSRSDDVYIICTDGLTDYIAEDEILNMYEVNRDIRSLSRHLVSTAKERGGKDNITLLIFEGEAIK